MKGLSRINSLGSVLVLGFRLAVLCAHADTIYLSTADLNSILNFDSGGSPSTFANASSGLNYPLGLAFDSSGNLYVANHGDTDILEFNPNGIGSVFASGLGNAVGIAIEVPEPSSFLLAALGALSLIAFLNRKRT
jgi:hypothetical protein